MLDHMQCRILFLIKQVYVHKNTACNLTYVNEITYGIKKPDKCKTNSSVEGSLQICAQGIFMLITFFNLYE